MMVVVFYPTEVGVSRSFVRDCGMEGIMRCQARFVFLLWRKWSTRAANTAEIFCSATFGGQFLWIPQNTELRNGYLVDGITQSIEHEARSMYSLARARMLLLAQVQASVNRDVSRGRRPTPSPRLNRFLGRTRELVFVPPRIAVASVVQRAPEKRREPRHVNSTADICKQVCRVQQCSAYSLCKFGNRKEN